MKNILPLLLLTVALLSSCMAQEAVIQQGGTLIISNQNIKKIDKKLLASDSLRKVIIRNCNLRKIRFPKGNKIEVIILASNSFDRIPRSIRRCKYLESLDMEHNKIRHIPRFIAQLDSLRSLDLNYNHLKLKKSDILHASKVKKLSLGANEIVQLPENIGILQCTNLNLGKNKLSSLPASFADLKQLRTIIFYENDFETIPEEISDFTELKHLDFYKNEIQEIPNFIGNYENLKYLYLSYNEIGAIPDTMKSEVAGLFLHPS